MISYLWSFTNYKINDRYKLTFLSERIFVNTNYGPVKGIKTTSSAFGYEYVTFQGIPYAKPPVGELRFRVSILAGNK